MKLIVAIIKPFKLEDVRAALGELGVPRSRSGARNCRAFDREQRVLNSWALKI